MPITSPNVLANGNIFPSTAVMPDTTVAGGNNVVQATANARCLGIAYEGSREAPIPSVTTPYAAQQGDAIKIYGDGDECLALLGGSVAVGDFLVASGPVSGLSLTQVYFDSVAFTLPTTMTGLLIKIGTEQNASGSSISGGVQNVVARALESGSAGDFRRVQVTIFQTTVSIS